MAFAEVKLFQVKPDKTEEFEELAKEMKAFQKEASGCKSIDYMKRFFIFDKIEQPPRQLTKIVKCVKYYSYWQFDSIDSYHEATMAFFEQFYKRLQRILIMPFDINCGEVIDE